MRFKKMCATLAVLACGLMIGNGNVITWAEEVAQNTNVDYSDLGVRRPRIYNDSKDVYLDTGKVKGATWNADKKELTLDNFKGKGHLWLDYYDAKNYDYEKNKDKYAAEQQAHKSETITLVVKGDCTIDGYIDCRCNLKITGGGSLSVLEESENSKRYEYEPGWYTISTGEFMDEEDKLSDCGDIEVSNVTIKAAIFYGKNIKFDNAKVNRKFRLATMTLAEGTDCFYAPFAVCETISVNNCKMNFRYEEPAKNQMNYSLYDQYCFNAQKINITDSTIKFKGKEKAYMTYPSMPFGEIELSAIQVKNSKIGFRKGQCFLKDDYIYRFSKVNNGKISEASIHKVYNDGKKKYIIDKTIKAFGKKFKIVGIDSSSFDSCREMKTVIIKGKSIRRIGKNAFVRYPEVKKSITFKVPKAKKKLYTSFIKKAGTKKFVVK